MGIFDFFKSRESRINEEKECFDKLSFEKKQNYLKENPKSLIANYVIDYFKSNGYNKIRPQLVRGKEQPINIGLPDHSSNKKSWSEGYKKNGKKEGLWKNYNEEGKLTDEYYFENDKLNGLWTCYFFGLDDRVVGKKISYEENFKEGLSHGKRKNYNEKGELISTSIWKNGKFISEEIQETNKGSTLENKLDVKLSMLKDGYTGKGTYIFPNGDKYVGSFEDGYRHGKGVFTWTNGARYKGDFIKDQMEGKGSIVSPDGDKYVGEFRKNKKNGKGTYTWANGDKYVGEFKDQKYHGKGKLTYSDGKTEEGKFVNGFCIDQNAILGTGYEKEEQKVESTIQPKEFNNTIMSMFDFNIDSHTFSDGTTVYKGDAAFSKFIVLVDSVARAVKLNSFMSKKNKSGNEIRPTTKVTIGGKTTFVGSNYTAIYHDWEGIKEYFEMKRGCKPEEIRLCAEAILACEFDFTGRIINKTKTSNYNPFLRNKTLDELKAEQQEIMENGEWTFERFGRLNMNMYLTLIRYWKQEIDEQEADNKFAIFNGNLLSKPPTFKKKTPKISSANENAQDFFKNLFGDTK